MKKILYVLILCISVFLFSACALLAPFSAVMMFKDDNSSAAEPSEATTEATAAATGAVTVPTENATTAPTTEPTTEPATEPTTQPPQTEETNPCPYTVRLPAYRAIYNGPGMDTGYVRAVAEKGVYTIMEESTDSVGNLWGRLKSGLGWVILRISTTYSGPICSRCGTTDPGALSNEWQPGGMCISCNRDVMHFGEDGGLYCKKCGADCSYLGLEDNGFCEFCNQSG